MDDKTYREEKESGSARMHPLKGILILVCAILAFLLILTAITVIVWLIV